MTLSSSPGPGLARPRSTLPTFEQRVVGMRTVESIWRHMLETADVVSEGRVDDDGVYRGSTSLLLAEQPVGPVPRGQVGVLVRAAFVDPHFRLHVVRLARREAFWRSGGQLDTVQIEMAVRAVRDGLQVQVDVQATVVGAQRASV